MRGSDVLATTYFTCPYVHRGLVLLEGLYCTHVHRCSCVGCSRDKAEQPAHEELSGEPVMGSPELQRLFYMSFAKPRNEGGWLGGLFVRADTPQMAHVKSYELNANPGGEMCLMEFSPITRVPEEFMNRLLTMEEVDAIGNGHKRLDRDKDPHAGV